MNLIAQYCRDLGRGIVGGWNRFWFAPADPATLGLVRILAGAMLLYTHLVWSLRLNDFFGDHAWISAEAVRMQTDGPGGDATWAFSWFWLIHSSALLWAVHIAALAVFAMLMLGLFSRVVSVLAFVSALSYVNRTPGALFGLDQINLMLAMYLMVGPCGDAFSLDRWRAAKRAGEEFPPAEPSTGANLAIRLVQVHMCIIYFFAGLSKMQGQSWWFGDALWGAFANFEYQSMDMTWMHNWPYTVAIMTQTTVYWELFFPVLVWPRLTRPIVLLLALPLHLGIGLCLGMWTFGLVMLIGCASFISPHVVRAVLDRDSIVDEEEEPEPPPKKRVAPPKGTAQREAQTARS
ncbi:MAG TPA: HTTM domain-containing protein [Pirellulales bacterium]|jgi:hypothetical protein|nr:HTTM domain-containing protein [Pirellulales bacterium]